MFDLQGDRQITIEQESLGGKEDMEEDDQDEHQKGYSSSARDTATCTLPQSVAHAFSS